MSIAISSRHVSYLPQVALTAYAILSEIHSDLEDGLEMIPPSQIALLLADWTDPRNIMFVFSFGYHV